MASNKDLAAELFRAFKGYEEAARLMSTMTSASEESKQEALDKASDRLVAAVQAVCG